MQIILTHEQADFDALASMLGAHLLDRGAVPVLPIRLNRNLRAFLTLYGALLPFSERRDLPAAPIEAVTLVDSQSLVSIKGMHADTTVRVVDHHPPRPDLPETWQVVSDETGANTTLFVEEIYENGMVLDPIHATLLLMGIYEDTGSLTYSRTTARDLHAAAFLLEQGANLEIANEFLNHPLSLEQEALYDLLEKTADTHLIHGHTVMIAAGDARDINEELSTIAHKLRNVLEPDALFLLLAVGGGVQLIARSTDDHIDVSEVAAAFGGGGHPRAAAALIKQGDLQAVKRRLIEMLPDSVHPAITVAELMSRGPQVLPAETPVEAALQRMQRYGYEGYPVVEDGQLVGLLTRRAVDRAVAHKLNLKARSLMQAGNVTVLPTDSIEHLQNLMTESGWGQIPVIHPQTHEIIGIVTRTDLINTLASQFNHLGRQNLSARLEAFLTPARLALLKTMAEAAHRQRVALYIVGGFVRDLLLERPSLDMDLVVEGDAIKLAEDLTNHFGGRLTSHGRFGTAKWHLTRIKPRLATDLAPMVETRLDPENFPDYVDLISARTEYYTEPTALPTVERGSIKLDLHRRDFTINTLALRLDGQYYGELHDYWGGLADLNHGKVRVLHSISFVDDPTRMLRAVRYEQRYGFSIEKRTLQLLSEARGLLGRVSGERIRHELDRILEEKQHKAMLARLHDLGLLSQIHPDLSWDDWLDEHFERLNELPAWKIPPLPRGYPLHRALAYTLWFIRLPAKSQREILAGLVYPRSLGDQILAAGRVWRMLTELPGLQPSQVARRLDPQPALALLGAYLSSDQEAERQVVAQYYTVWRNLAPVTTGHTLREMELPPGPQYQQILTELRDAWLNGEVHNVEQEQQLLQQIIKRL
jgi:tRNA nucleotidyltransferase (CCA-adding enzyme)